MGICIAQAEILMLQQLRSEQNFRLMVFSETRTSISSKLGEEITNYQELQDYENECIELAFEAETEGLDTSSDEYTEAYQEYLELKEDISKKYDRLIEKTQRELDRKEQAMDIEQEQLETQLEATDANLESYEALLEKNAKDEFGYFD